MQASRKRGLRATLAALVLAASQPAAAQFNVSVWHDGKDIAHVNCVAALKASTNLAQIPDIAITVEDRQSGGYPDVPLILFLSNGDRDRNAINVVSVPQAVRDAAHLKAFIDSPFFAQLRTIDRHADDSRHPWLALGYGGFYQLFSRERALTEPKHFYEQMIGGAQHAHLYDKLGASFMSITISAGVQQASMDASDIEHMGLTGSRMAAVEAPLINAESTKLDGIARYVNMTFSALHPVLFSAERYRYARLPDSVKRRIERWVTAAAETCSAENYQAEQAIMQRLKAKGLRIVPVNRPALVEAGWTYAMSWGVSSITWTLADLDQLVRLAKPPLLGKTPRAVADALPAKERTALRARMKEVATDRAKVVVPVTAEQGQQPTASAWRREAETLATHLRANAAASKQPVQADKPAAVRVDKVREVIDAYVASLTEWELRRQCANSCIAGIGGLTLSARAACAIGDAPRGAALIDKAEGLIERPFSTHETRAEELVDIAYARGSCRDPGAAAALARATAALDPDRTNVGIWARLATLAHALGDKDKTTEFLTRAHAGVGNDIFALTSLIDRHIAFGNRAAAIGLLATTLEESEKPSDMISITLAAGRLWPPLNAEAAAAYERVAEVQRTNMPNSPPAGASNAAHPSWLDILRGAVLHRRLAEDTAGLVALRSRLAALPATKSEADARKPLLDHIASDLAFLYFKRGDKAASVAADGGKHVAREEAKAAGGDRASWPAVLKQATAIADRYERGGFLREMVSAAAKAGDIETVREAVRVANLFDSRLWETALRSIAPLP
jgi:TRAP-type C4-dicarboxylate transport system substrate-binding protein